MPKLACSCGATLHYGEIPCPIEWLLYADIDFDMLPATVETETLYRKAKSLLCCPDCGRLWIFWNGFQSPPREYVPAEPRETEP